MNEIARIEHPNADVRAYRASTEAADLCREIVVATSSDIQGRRFVSVEGWQALATAHGCVLSARDVERIEGGVRAVGEVRRMSDGQLLATGEGFVGEDEPTWFGGEMKNRYGTKVLPKRADYAIRAMAQTRAMSRAGRTAFAHVVVMMKAGLATTPAEEMVTYDAGTGEVIETIPTHEPATREKLDGPFTSKTALKAAITKVVRAVEKADSIEALDALKAEHKRTINQALRDWPELVDGNPNVPEDIGLKGSIEKRRSELSISLGFQFLASAIETSSSLDDLRSLLDEHAEAIAELDGEESRRFETAYNEREAALRSPTPLTAGAYGA